LNYNTIFIFIVSLSLEIMKTLLDSFAKKNKILKLIKKPKTTH